MVYNKRFMDRAIDLASEAASMGEIPVGVVIVKDDEIIAEGYNRREIDKNPLAHAEIIAIESAAQKLGGWRLIGCQMYVTLEPCMMCAGAIVQSRVEHVYIGASDPKAGCVTSKLHLWDEAWINHKPEYSVGHEQDRCSEILKVFFKLLRNR